MASSTVMGLRFCAGLTRSTWRPGAPSASASVPAGSSFADFPIATTGAGTSAAVTISAVYGGVTQNATLTVDPAVLSSVSLSPFSLTGGTLSTGTVAMLGKAPAGGVVMTLASSDTNVATVPASVTVSSGASTATFTVATNSAVTSGSATEETDRKSTRLN